MSTRCWIGQKREDGIHSFYCHHDGYLKYPGVGYNLLTNYNSEELATKLVDLCEPYGTDAVEDTMQETEKCLFIDDVDMPHPVFKTKKEYVSAANFDIANIFLWDKGWKIWCGGSFRFITPKMVEKK